MSDEFKIRNVFTDLVKAFRLPASDL